MKDTEFDLSSSLGGVASPEDYRDVPLAAVSPMAAAAFPASAFVDTTGMPIWMQNKLGACVGHAGGKYKQKLDDIETGSYPPLSARFLYAMAKAVDNNSDEGTYPRLVAQIMKDFGCATEDTVPNNTLLAHEAYVYNRNRANIPGYPSFPDAAPFKIGGYAFLNVKSVDDFKNAVVNFNGAMLLVRLGNEWWTNKSGVSSWQASDILPLRAPVSPVSGHEIYLYGYEVVGNRTKIHIVNSWSDAWGDHGKGWFWYDEYAPFIVEGITAVDLPNHIQDTLNQLPTKETFKHNFTVQISKGQTSAEVTALQTALMIDGDFDKALYTDLLKNNKLGYYGAATAAAVLTYQKKYLIDTIANLTSVNGAYVGPKTRAHLNSWTNK